MFGTGMRSLDYEVLFRWKGYSEEEIGNDSPIV